MADLNTDQPLRRIQAEEAYKKIQSILDAIKEILGDNDDEDEETVGPVKKASEQDSPLKPFTVRLDDPAGNSFVEFVGSMADPKWNLRTYKRTKEQNIELGLVAEDAYDGELTSAKTTQLESKAQADELIGGGLEGENEEIFIFPGTCSSCGAHLDTLMKKVNIPYFKVRNFYAYVQH